MSEKFIELFETAKGIRNDAEDELWFHLSKCVGNTYKYINNGITFYIGVEYFRGFDKIGVNHINYCGESYTDIWDVEEFYEIIKDSTEVL